jgi:hypothetical protein
MRRAVISLSIAIVLVAMVWIGNLGFAGHVLVMFTAMVLTAYGCNEWDKYNNNKKTGESVRIRK